ncbi:MULTISPECIES: tyrosine recombinase XerC [Cytobacillus]|uniref:Tyrosine recombinase XerC n=1 Tax=Cytobacillus kochii TaxID=859143 RepID=A0A248TCS1_9BACI|nr:tyrosine recombinase XerC [Cytobacillus kochii]ASV65964.1 tyrosine recombinase XerC [Cytobacillus kochii]MCA1028459.1 tyrosine recombinase XerC [Cytobacillus kochii]MCM3321719.1 tyrosine recombinase XerC [Cytobacillus kochii]MCM3343447.1 tyrosine recombinase XerC [Cytobacillus kochii]MDQ0184836.1 integrase/recombinase XerC [Cytobacillus kochii]
MSENVNISLKLFIEYLQIEKNYSQYTIEHYQTDIKGFFMFMAEQGLKKLNDVEYMDVRLFLTKLYQEGLARKTIARKISCLRSFFKLLVREGMVNDNPFQLTSIPKGDKRLPQFFYEEEMEQLFNSVEVDTALGQRNMAILEVMYATGIRVAECASIQLSDIDLDISVILIHGKGKKDRYIPFGSFAHDALLKYCHDGRLKLQKEKSNHLFLNHRGGALTDRGIRGILNKLIEKSSLEGGIHPHKIRHSFATHLMSNGADMRTVQELLGHAFLSSTQIYTHVTPDYLKKTYNQYHPRA